jgi:hypothetical protein
MANFERVTRKRLTDCCAWESSYYEGPSGNFDVLCCKKCYHPVPTGHGDGGAILAPDNETVMSNGGAYRLDTNTGRVEHIQREPITLYTVNEVTWND